MRITKPWNSTCLRNPIDARWLLRLDTAPADGLRHGDRELGPGDGYTLQGRALARVRVSAGRGGRGVKRSHDMPFGVAPGRRTAAPLSPVGTRRASCGA